MAGVTGEATAQYLTKALYNKAPSELTASEKETISSLSQLAGGLAGAFTAKANGSGESQGGSFLSGVAGAETAKRAVENNYLSPKDVQAFYKDLEKAIKEGKNVDEVYDYYSKLSQQQRDEVLANCDAVCRLTVKNAINSGTELAYTKADLLSGWLSGLSSEERSRFLTLVENENNQTIAELRERQTLTEKTLELGLDTARLLRREEGSTPSNQHSFAKKTGKQKEHTTFSRENRIPGSKTNDFIFENAPYHSKQGNSVKSPTPTFGQEVLNESIQVKSSSPRRIGVDKTTGEYVVFDKTEGNIYHGHVRKWDELTIEMKNALQKANLVTNKGKIK
ncbi:VENN motif pre-toxin domain-containing protein [Avibacterium paragallinarum]|uniref:VENN motif pre-toxin domain-containing protein n=1 Tax=Avibacterium paragallinarum TaxID=728 RepID=UPI00397B198A